MTENNSINQKEQPDNAEKKASWGMRQYGVYSTVVFQMLATMGLAFWGGKKINDYFEIESNLLTLAIGLTGMALAFYNLLRQLKEIQKDEK